jgi:hypothetical protein
VTSTPNKSNIQSTSVSQVSPISKARNQNFLSDESTRITRSKVASSASKKLFNSTDSKVLTNNLDQKQSFNSSCVKDKIMPSQDIKVSKWVESIQKLPKATDTDSFFDKVFIFLIYRNMYNAHKKIYICYCSKNKISNNIILRWG